jgi:hypothetical protein
MHGMAGWGYPRRRGRLRDGAGWRRRFTRRFCNLDCPEGAKEREASTSAGRFCTNGVEIPYRSPSAAAAGSESAS